MIPRAFGLERLGLLCLKVPKISLAILAALTAFALYGMLQVDYDDDLRNLLRSDREVPRTYDRFLERFPALENQVFLLVEGDTLIDKARLEAVRTLHLDLQFVDGVTGVLSIFTARHAPDASGDLRPVLPDQLPDGAALEKLVDDARDHPLLADKMLSRDGGATLLVVNLEAGLREFDQFKQLFSEIDTLAGEVMGGMGLTVTPTGEPAIRYEILTIIRNDMRMLNLVGALIAVLVCALFFRRPVLILLASFAPMVGVVWTIGGFGLLGQKITAMSNILPTLVLVIGFSDALHMVFSIRRLMQEGKSPREAAETSIREVGPACAMTSITTMIALGSLAFSESVVVQQFGIGGAVAVLIAFIVIVVLIPAMAVVLLPYTKSAKQPSTGGLLTKIAGDNSIRAWRMVERRPVLVSITGAVLLAITGTAYFQLEPAYNYREYLSPQSPANQAIDRVNEKLGGADVIFVMIERASQDAKAHSADVIEAVHNVTDSQPDVDNVTSLASIRRWLKRPVPADARDNSDILEKMPEHYAERIASPERDAWIVSGYVPAAPAPATLARLRKLDAELETVRAEHPGYRVGITGVIALAAYESGQMIEGLKRSLTAAIFIIVVIIGITARSVTLAGLSVVPNLLSLSVVAAALYALGFGFQFTSVIALTVAFGIAVDNTVHFLNRYQLERRNSDPREALAATMAKVGPVLIAATAVLIFGIGVTQLSVLPMVQLFGRLCIVILCAALFATLMLLPALILNTAQHLRKI
ncbi:MAG: efflux RND transporter permease subunit [Hyphomicrobiales bacterium]